MPEPNRFRGRIVEAFQQRVALPNGASMLLDVVRHPGGAGVVAVDGRGEVCLLRQYRPVLQEWLWEIPAGVVDAGETPRAAALRELAEETGLAAERLEPLGAVCSSPGVYTEQVHLYLATGLRAGGASPDRDELFEIRWLALDEAVAMARDGTIRDAKSVAGLWRAEAALRARAQT